MLDFVHKTLDQMPFFVNMRVIFTHHLAIFSWRNDGLDAFLCQKMQKIIGIIATVGNEPGKRKVGHQRVRLRHVMPLAAGQKKAQRVPQGVHGHMNFGTKPAPTAAQRLFCLSAVFFEAPAAQGWARTTVLSRSPFSRSGSSAKC